MSGIPDRLTEHPFELTGGWTLNMDDIEYEEITSEEVDRVVATLESLIGSVSSETIKSFLEECSTNVYYLVYDDDESAAAA